MTTPEIKTAIGQWLNETIEAIEHVYDHVPASKPEAMPDAVIENARQRVTPSDPDSDNYVAQIANTYLRLWEVNVSIMVDNSDPAAAEGQLDEFSDLLIGAITKDGSLGGRVPFASRQVEIDNTSPFVEYQDGTKGREMVLTMTVGENLEVN